MELLERHFETAFAAPDGIKKLRELILTLAMQGRLVPQDPNDPPASELLKAIETEKKRMVKEGKIKDPKPLPRLSPEDVPYALPKGWQWVRLGNVGSTNIGLTYSPSDVSESGVPVLRSNNVQNGMLDLSDVKRVAVEVKKSVLVQEGDLLICARNGSRALVGKTAMIPALPEEMAFGAFMAIFRSQINPFLLRFINSPLFRLMIDEVNTVTINQITQGNLRSTAFPLPPLPEQHRIIAKIDELMGRCDALEKLRTERDAQRLAVHTAAIRQLLNMTNTDGHIQAREFLSRHFGELYADKKNVAELRKAILQLAVIGKLVPQAPNDPPASELLKQIEAEKKRLVKAGKIKEPKQMVPVLDREIPFRTPESWNWVRLGDLGNSQTGTTPPSNNQSNFGDHIPFIGPGDIKDGNIDYSGKGLSSSGMSIARVIEVGSLLMVCIGGSIGKQAINARTITCNQQINTLTPYKPLPVRFVYWLTATPWFQNSVLDSAGGSATPIINKQKWSSIIMPLPPLAEQHRIVAKIDQLMSLCDALEQQIDAARETQSAMLSVMMAQFGGQRCA